MPTITTAADLADAIQQLETKRSGEWIQLREQFMTTYENLKPINLLKRSFKEVITAPDLKTTIGNAAIGLVSGFIAKKAILGKTNNPLTKLLGILIEMVVAGKVVKNAEGIKSFGGMLLNKFIGKNDKV